MSQDTITVYIVDDDDSIRRALKRLLRSVGYHTLDFGSAEEFLEFKSKPDEGCLVLDINLPKMTGLVLQETLASRGSNYSIIFMTAYDNPQWEEKAKKAGAIAYLRKPFDEQTLLKAVDQCPQGDYYINRK